MKDHHQQPSQRRQSGARAYRISRTYTEGRSREEAVRNLLRAHL